MSEMAKQKLLVGKASLTQARTTTGRIAFIRKGGVAPGDLSADDRTRLIKEGYLHEVEVIGDPDADRTPAPDSVEGILAAVGDDKVKAAAALDTEKAKGDKARKTLVDPLEAIVKGS